MKKFLMLMAIAFLSIPAYAGEVAMASAAKQSVQGPKAAYKGAMKESSKEASQEEEPATLSNADKMQKAVDDLKLASKRLAALAQTDPEAKDLQVQVDALVDKVDAKKKDVADKDDKKSARAEKGAIKEARQSTKEARQSTKEARKEPAQTSKAEAA